MNIVKIEPVHVSLPYSHDGPLTGFGGSVWPTLSYLLIRVETDDRLVGWGEAFGYGAIPATIAAMETLVRPLALGRDASDIGALMISLKKPLHIFGRSGPVQYALSGLDIALWDLAGKRAGKSVGRLLSPMVRESVPAYKSFMRLERPEIITQACRRALAQGFQSVKLHEVTIDAVAAARSALGDAVSLTLDVNCAWPVQQAVQMATALLPYRLKWLEEPVWPPEDVVGLAALRRAVDIPVALGENLANASAFAPLMDNDVISFFQPSVTKMGGITEFRAVAQAAARNHRAVAPHSPYFGPGLLATLQLAAAFPCIGSVEVFGVDLEQTLFGATGTVGADGSITIPSGPGLGADPDLAVIERYRV